MAYNILDRDYKHSTINGSITGAVCSIYCDSESDLPTTAEITKEGILAGSWAWLATERNFKTLTTAGEWV